MSSDQNQFNAALSALESKLHFNFSDKAKVFVLHAIFGVIEAADHKDDKVIEAIEAVATALAADDKFGDEWRAIFKKHGHISIIDVINLLRDPTIRGILEKFLPCP